ncbi:uncharacterized protein METZ01_LOCUS289862 [marine metagenome]|uniref:Uncharacterized protein n=1 Tax=marine metagenome TaxID=408172 RepID=A0A382LJN9_9ZZZZ
MLLLTTQQARVFLLQFGETPLPPSLFNVSAADPLVLQQ